MSELSPSEAYLVNKRKALKRRLNEIDDSLSKTEFNKAIGGVEDIIPKADMSQYLLLAKLKSQNMTLLSAVLSVQISVAELEMATHGFDFNVDRSSKKMKMDLLSGGQQPTQSKKSRSSPQPQKSSSSSSSQRPSTSRNNKQSKPQSKKKTASSQENKENLDSTLILKEILEGKDIVSVPAQSTPKKKRSPSLASTISTASERSISSSIASEFNRPYFNENSNEKKQSKSQNNIKVKTKTVADLKADIIDTKHNSNNAKINSNNAKINSNNAKINSNNAKINSNNTKINSNNTKSNSNNTKPNTTATGSTNTNYALINQQMENIFSHTNTNMRKSSNYTKNNLVPNSSRSKTLIAPIKQETQSTYQNSQPFSQKTSPGKPIKHNMTSIVIKPSSFKKKMAGLYKTSQKMAEMSEISQAIQNIQSSASNMSPLETVKPQNNAESSSNNSNIQLLYQLPKNPKLMH